MILRSSSSGSSASLLGLTELDLPFKLFGFSSTCISLRSFLVRELSLEVKLGAFSLDLLSPGSGLRPDLFDQLIVVRRSASLSVELLLWQDFRSSTAFDG